MKKITSLLLLILATLIFSLKSRSQTWSMLTSGITTHITGVSIVDANICFVSGDAGEILKTIDGGITWIPQVSGTSENLLSIRFTDANNGIVVGNNGAVRRTTNGGTTWTGLSITTDDLRFAYFFDINTGYICGGVSATSGSIFKTIDGGATWTPLPIVSGAAIYSVKFTSLVDGHACNYDGVVFKTINGGASWTSMSGGITSPFYANDFPTASIGIVVSGSGAIRRTTNSGMTWSGVLSGTSDPLIGLKFYDANNGYAVGGNIAANTGMIVSTINGGSSWSVYTPGCSRLYSVDFLNSILGYAVGLDGTILKYNRSVEIAEQNINASLITAYPNPASGSTTIDMSKLHLKKSVTMELFDISGKLARRTERITTDQFSVSQDNLSTGEYFFNILESEQIVGRGKIIFK